MLKRIARWLLILLAVAVVLLSWPSYQFYKEISKSISEDPLVWEQDIEALERNSNGKYPPNHAVVFVGSSSIRLWHDLASDMAPIAVLQHGFGGAKLNDVVHYADRLVSNYQPQAVVVFAGTNDITPQAAKSPETLLHSYQQLVNRLRNRQSRLPIYYIAITPSVMRWEVWDSVKQTNELIAQYSNNDDQLFIIDTGPALIGPDGTPDPANYVIDGLHLSEQGYSIWAGIIKSRLSKDMPHLIGH